MTDNLDASLNLIISAQMDIINELEDLKNNNSECIHLGNRVFCHNIKAPKKVKRGKRNKKRYH